MAGNLANAVNSDVCKLSVDAAEYVTLFDIELGKTHPRNRRSTRGGKLDTYGPPLEDLSATVTADKDIANRIEALATQNARKAFTKGTCIITGQSLSGAADDIIVNCTAEFYEYRLIGPEGGQDVTFRFAAIIDNDIVITG
jgi:hypothetical protein